MTKPIEHPTVRPLALIPRTKGIFNQELVGRVAGYPHSEVIFNEMKANLKAHSDRASANGTKARTHIPNGYTRATAAEARAYAAKESKRIMRAVYAGSLDPLERPDPALSPNSDMSRGELALTCRLEMALGPCCPRFRQRSWLLFIQWLKAPGERPANMADGYRWLLNLAKPGCNESYQMPVPGLPVKQTQAELEASTWLGSLIGEP